MKTFACMLMLVAVLPLAGMAMPLNKQWDRPRADIPKGTLESYTFTSRILKNRREIWVYTPSTYSQGKSYPLLIVLDGQAYTSQLIPGPTILDNLIAEKRIPPLVAVFVSSMDQTHRNRELPCYALFIDSLATELLQWVYTNYHVSKQADQTIIAGSSYGGLAAAYAALQRPQTFGKVLSQSGAFWWHPKGEQSELWFIQQYENNPTLPVSFYLDVGNREDQSMVQLNRRFADVLQRKGYLCTYHEFQGGHEYECWRKTFATGLIALMGQEK